MGEERTRGGGRENMRWGKRKREDTAFRWASLQVIGWRLAPLREVGFSGGHARRYGRRHSG